MVVVETVVVLVVVVVGVMKTMTLNEKSITIHLEHFILHRFSVFLFAQK